MRTQWQGHTGGGNFGQRALISLFEIFGSKPLYAVAAFAVPFYMLFARKGYLAVYRYFSRQWGFSTWKSFLKTYHNHFVFAQIILDRFAVFAGRTNDFDIEIVGNEHFVRLSEGDKGFVMAGSHLGSFEIGGYLLRTNKKRINALIYAGETQTMQNNRSRISTANNINLIPVSNDMSHLFAVNAALQNGEIVSMPCDRNHGSTKSARCDFLRGQADFPVGAFALATSFDVEVLAIFTIKVSAKKYKVFVRPLAAPSESTSTSKRERIEKYVKSYVSELENVLTQYPEQWFNYYEFWKEQPTR